MYYPLAYSLFICIKCGTYWCTHKSPVCNISFGITFTSSSVICIIYVSNKASTFLFRKFIKLTKKKKTNYQRY